MHRLTKEEIIIFVWDVPLWILDEIKWSIYNRCKAIMIRMGFDA